MACVANAPLPEQGASMRRRRSSTATGTVVGDPFVKAAQTQGAVQVAFEAKYYGRCDIPADVDMPDVANVVAIMTARKKIDTVLRCNVHFSQHGVTIEDLKSKTAAVSWTASRIVSCATMRHPTVKSRRLGLLKVRSRTSDVCAWHLFKYYGKADTDNMATSFAFMLDCSLREIGKTVAKVGQQHTRTRLSEWNSVVPPTFDNDNLDENMAPIQTQHLNVRPADNGWCSVSDVPDTHNNPFLDTRLSTLRREDDGDTAYLDITNTSSGSSQYLDVVDTNASNSTYSDIRASTSANSGYMDVTPSAPAVAYLDVTGSAQDY
eukprot:m.169513 g.169513  ORF g.169513 m.169513 type:complete len:320 (+) comp13111_c0_seq1:201-1160(+)